jgi:hypothetical protein
MIKRSNFMRSKLVFLRRSKVQIRRLNLLSNDQEIEMALWALRGLG